MVAAGLAFTAMLSFIKLARQDMDPFSIILWRSFVAIPLVALLSWNAGYRLKNIRSFSFRCAWGLCAMVGFYTASKGLPITDQSLIAKLQPIAVALIAPWILGKNERTNAGLWLVMIAGFSGCFLIIAPELQVGTWYGVTCLVATLCSGCAHVVIRGLTRSNAPETLVFWFQIVVGVFGFVAVLMYTGGLHLPPSHHLVNLVGVGICATAGQALMTRAYALDKAAPVAAAGFTSPIWAILGDLVVFDFIPSWTALLGGMLVILAGMTLVVQPRRQPPPRTSS